MTKIIYLKMNKEEANKNIDNIETDEDNSKFIQQTNLDINKDKSDSEKVQRELKSIPNEAYSSLNQHDEQDDIENIITQNNNEVISDKKNELDLSLLNKNKGDKTSRCILYLLIIFILSVIFYFMIIKNSDNEASLYQENKPIKEQKPNDKEESIKKLFGNVEHIKE